MSIDDISDTARWMAYIRALETERADAIFHDPFSRRLAGAAGEAIARSIGDVEMISRGIAVRTAVMDEMILRTVEHNAVDLVLNLAAGLDTRPWRLALPDTLQWIDVDLPAILEYKAGVMGVERPTCKYESLHADITDATARKRVFDHCSPAQRALIVTEGLLVYLTPPQVSALACDLHSQSAFAWWLTDLIGPRALATLRRVWGPMFRDVEFQFGPADSDGFFRQLGWHEQEFRSSQAEARRLRRSAPAALLTRLLLLFSSTALREEFHRLSGVSLLKRGAASAATAS